MSTRRFISVLWSTSVLFASASLGVAVSSGKAVHQLNARGFYDHLDPENFIIASVIQSPYEGPIPVSVWTEPQSLPQGSWNITLTTQRAVRFIHEAAAGGVGLLAFPEVWFPGYPFSMKAEPKYTQEYIDNALVEGDSNWNALVDAVKEAGIYVAIGATERRGDLLFMTQVFWSPEGEKLIHRQKVRASEYERNLWSDGDWNDLKVVATPYGRIGLLECWEHLHPQMTFPMQAQLEDIHVAMYPEFFDPHMVDDPSRVLHPFSSMKVNMAGVHVYTATSKTWTVVAVNGGGLIMNPVGVIQSMMGPFPQGTYDAPTYHGLSVNTTTFRKDRTYEVNSQFGFGSMLEMIQAYPDYIPKDTGTWVLRKEVPVSQLLEQAANNIAYFDGDDSAETVL